SGLVEGTRLRRRRVPPLSKGCWLSRWQGRLGLDADHPCQSQAAGARRNSEICDWYERRLAKLIAFFEATSQVGKRLEDSSASPNSSESNQTAACCSCHSFCPTNHIQLAENGFHVRLHGPVANE